MDWYEGGYWVSNTEYQWKWDINGLKDFYHNGIVSLWLSHPNDGLESVTITGHSTDSFNGEYWRLGYWNGKPHWAKIDNSAHLYYFSYLGENYIGYWQMSAENQWQ